MAKRQKDKTTNNDPQNITQKTKDRVTRTPLKSGVELRCSGRVSSSCSLMQEEFEDTKEVIKIRISKKNRQLNGQKKMYKRKNNYLQNIHIKPKIE
jgi:hypothetical protein